MCPTELRTAYTTLADKFDAPTLVHLIALCEADAAESEGDARCIGRCSMR